MDLPRKHARIEIPLLWRVEHQAPELEYDCDTNWSIYHQNQPEAGGHVVLVFNLPLVSRTEREVLLRTGQLVSIFFPYVFAEETLWLFAHYADATTRNTARIPVEIAEHYKAHLLNNTFYRTSDPRDSVFALRDVLPQLSEIDLDYTSSPEQIFCIATEALLRRTRGGLGELQQWFHPQASPQLPSWVFDFTHCNINIDENGYEGFLGTRTLNECDASADSFFRAGHCNKTSMHVAGFVCDEIVGIGDFVDREQRPNLPWWDQLRMWTSFAAAHIMPKIASRKQLGMFTRTFVRTCGLHHLGKKHFTLTDLRLIDSVRWELTPFEVLMISLNKFKC
jgi:hypothetical protein